MRALLRYVLLSGILVAVVFALFAVPLGGRSAFGQVRAYFEKNGGSVLAQIKKELDEQMKAKKPEATETSEDPARAKKLARLEAASKQVGARSVPASRGSKAQREEKLSTGDKKALDQLVASRLLR